MNTKALQTMLVRTMSIMVILAVMLAVSPAAYAASSSPFAGKWEAVDVDGSEMTLAIGGPPTGPFQITWTDKYISFCAGQAGVVRGTGVLNASDPNLLEAQVLLECFTTGESLTFEVTFRHHPVTNTLSIKYYFGQVTIWHRPGGRRAAEPPALNLRVNYGHDWVESFYEGGHTVWISVLDGDGNVKATTELVTEPKDYWGDETGFQSFDGVWFDAAGNQMENAPDIQPYDWVYGWVDNGVSAQVQIGEISGTIDLETDTIGGTVNAPWFSDQQQLVEVECLPWGSPKPSENMLYGMLMPDHAATYTCSWDGNWNILPYQNVGVGYAGPDGHWVANAFSANAPQIIASESGNWFWTTGFAPGMLELAIFESANAEIPIWSSQQEADASGFTFVGYDVHGQDLVEGNYLVVSDGVYPKGLELLPTAVTVFDTEYDFMAGIAPAGSEVWAAAGPQEWQQRIFVEADPLTGEWRANYADISFDITEEMRPWSYSHIYDDDGDANEGSTPPPPVIFAHPAYNFVEGTQWTPNTEVTVTIDDPTNGEGVDYSATSSVDSDTWVRFELEFDLQVGHFITMTDGHKIRAMVVSNLRVTRFNLDAHAVYGVGDPGSEFFIADNGMTVQVDGDGNWNATIDALEPGSWWTIIQRYEDGNEIRETFRAPMPMLIAWKNWDDVVAYEWTPGAEVILTIDDPANGRGIDYTFTQIAADSGNLYYGEVYFDLGIEIETGYVLTVSDGSFSKMLVISALTVTGFDFDNRIIHGTGDPGTQLFVYINGSESDWTIVGDDHNWSVYHELLEPGVWLDATQPDEDGDQTRDGGQAF